MADMRVPSSQIVLSGQSLGTGVACALAGRRLAPEGKALRRCWARMALTVIAGIIPRSLILTAPFTSIRHLLLTYKLAEIIPVLQPLRYFPALQRKYSLNSMVRRIDTY